MGCQYKTMDMDNAPLNGTGTGDARANSEHCRIHCGQILSSISSGILHLAIRSPSFATRAMLTATHRLLRLLSLLQTRSHWSGPELATTLEVHPRTLRRDIDKLRELGYPSTPAAASPAAMPCVPARPCRRCCWTTRKRWRLPSRCARRPPARWAASRKPAARADQAGTGHAGAPAPAHRRCAPPSCRWSRMAPRWTRRCWPRWRRPAAINCGWRLIIGMGAARPARAWWNRKAWRTPASAGTWWPGIRRAMTGASSAWTALPGRRPRARTSRRVPRLAGRPARVRIAHAATRRLSGARAHRAACATGGHGRPHPVRRRRDR